MPLSDTSILQINATIIAGILILLTISSFNIYDNVSHNTKISNSNQTNTQTDVQNKHNTNPRYYAGYLIFPFALSASLAIIRTSLETMPTFTRVSNGIYGASYASMLSGFFGLIGFAFFLQFQ